MWTGIDDELHLLLRIQRAPLSILVGFALGLLKEKQPTALVRSKHTVIRLDWVTMVKGGTVEGGSKGGESVVSVELKMIMHDLLLHCLSIAGRSVHVSARDSCNNCAAILELEVEALGAP